MACDPKDVVFLWKSPKLETARRSTAAKNGDLPCDLNMRLLSYNIHKGIGGRDRRYRLERIKQAIERENPDVICLQEVDRNVRRSRSDNQPLLLGKYFRAAGRCFQLNHRLKTGGYGNLVLSRWPVLTRHNISLRQAKRKERGALLVVIDTPEGPLHVANCHLGLAEQERKWQVDRLLDHRLFAESAHLPTVVAGDMNDWRNKLDAGPFKEHDFKRFQPICPSRRSIKRSRAAELRWSLRVSCVQSSRG